MKPKELLISWLSCKKLLEANTARLVISDSSISPEVRIGWEAHMRIGALVTWRP